MISQAQIDTVVQRIVENVNPEKIILFGSYAEGNPNENSDLDILIIKETDMPRYKRNSEVKKYLRGLKIPIDVVVYSQKEIDEWKNVKTSFVNNVLEKGKVLYG